jgi:hypothetical protein
MSFTWLRSVPGNNLIVHLNNIYPYVNLNLLEEILPPVVHVRDADLLMNKVQDPDNQRRVKTTSLLNTSAFLLVRS